VSRPHEQERTLRNQALHQRGAGLIDRCGVFQSVVDAPEAALDRTLPGHIEP
jgi:hypothetical protein